MVDRAGWGSRFPTFLQKKAKRWGHGRVYLAEKRCRWPECGLADSYVAAADDFVLSAGDAGDGLGVGDVLLGEDTAGEGVGIVAIEHRNGALQHDHAVVQVLIDKMHRASGNFDAVIEGLLLGFKAGKRGQQRRVNVEDAVGIGRDEPRGQKPHVARQANQVHMVPAQAGEYIRIVIGAGTAPGNKKIAVEAEFTGSGKAGGIGYVGDDHRNLDSVKAALADGPGDGEEVRPAAGEKYAEAKG